MLYTPTQIAVAQSPPTSQTAFSCHNGLVFPVPYFCLPSPAMADRTFHYKSGSHPGLVHTFRSYLKLSILAAQVGSSPPGID